MSVSRQAIRPANGITVVNGVAVLKRYREPWRRINELRAVRLVALEGVAVAGVLWSLARPVCHTAFVHVPGRTLTAADGVGSLAAALDYLSAVHEVCGPGFGRVIEPTATDWRSFVTGRLDGYRAALAAVGLTGPALVAEQLRDVPPPPAPTPLLLHSDPNPANFLTGPRGLVGVDWELAMFGDPDLDIARAAWEWGIPPVRVPTVSRRRPDSDTIRYYQALHTLGRLMGSATSVCRDVALEARCLQWLTTSPWRASMKIGT